MDRKLSDIAKYIDSSNIKFEQYLKDTIGLNIYGILKSISLKTGIYIFSGIIRNYFTKQSGVRDLDVVLDSEIDLLNYFNNSKIERNSFGGYRIYEKYLKIDLWCIKDTWAYKLQKAFDFNLNLNIPTTAFFNFSAIIYSINKEQFIYTKHFLRFLKYRKIDVVYKSNYNYDLCIVNSLYYTNKYNYKLADNFVRYLEYLYKSEKHDFKKVQLQHFEKILFSDKKIESFVEYEKAKLKMRLEKKKIKKNIDDGQFSLEI